MSAAVLTDEDLQRRSDDALLKDAAALGCDPVEARAKVAAAVDAATPWSAKIEQRVDEPPTRKYHRTDTGNGERMVDLFHDLIRFRYEGKGGGIWHVWDGRCWAPDRRGQVERYAKATVRNIWREVATIEDDDERKKVKAFASSSEGMARLDAMVKAARSDERIVIELADLDADPWSLNVANGIVNLKTGQLGPHDPAALHSKIARADLHDGDWREMAPTWAAFLERVLPSENLRGYVQRLAGYSLAGDVGENVLPFPYGSGANGKSVFLGVLSDVMGDYATVAAPELLVARRERGIPADVADLRGFRFVTTTEVEGGRAMATDVMKRITGEQKLKARRLHQNFEEWDNVTTLWMAANDYPAVDGLDEAIWRRVKTIPFEVVIPSDERDPLLHGKLMAEADGILRWLVDGMVRYQEQGLANEPDEVKIATGAYRAESNPLREWFEFECEKDPDGKVPVRDLRTSYDRWASVHLRRDDKLPNGKRWTDALESLGCRKERVYIDGVQVHAWLGMKLRKRSGGSQEPDAHGGLDV